VTNRQYQNEWSDQASADLPRVNVSWIETDQYCRSLGGRLPTEAEWECAARADADTAWFFGDQEAKLGDYAWYSENAGGKAHPVKTKAPNPWGLYDMYGNVWEWVNDWFGLYAKGERSVPNGPDSGDDRVLRGGSFDFSARILRSANRGRFRPEFAYWNIGFRCVLSPRRQP
jgi:formylglycine-generating enzyme required for sulfatase activity